MTAAVPNWQEWYDAHAARLLLFARQWLPERADAEDAVQIGFVKFWRNRPRPAVTRPTDKDAALEAMLAANADQVAATDQPPAPAPATVTEEMVTWANGDVVVDDKQGAAQVVPFQGENWGGNVIIMKGLRLQVPGGGDAQANGPDAKENAPMRKQPYLGVVATPVSAAVRAQLELPEGVGVSVDAVAAGSPAEQAGLKPFDVIRMFNDPLIVSDEQLTTLIRAAGAGTKVPLKVLRGGRERLVEAVLGERVVLADGTKVLGLEELMKRLGGNGLDQEESAGVERQLQEALKQAVAGGGGLPGVAWVGGGGRARVQSRVVAGGQSQSTTVVSDERGTVEINRSGDKQTVTVKDPAGKEVHAGPLDTAEDLAKVPEAYREWVRELAPREAELASEK